VRDAAIGLFGHQSNDTFLVLSLFLNGLPELLASLCLDILLPNTLCVISSVVVSSSICRLVDRCCLLSWDRSWLRCSIRRLWPLPILPGTLEASSKSKRSKSLPSWGMENAWSDEPEEAVGLCGLPDLLLGPDGMLNSGDGTGDEAGQNSSRAGSSLS